MNFFQHIELLELLELLELRDSPQISSGILSTL